MIIPTKRFVWLLAAGIPLALAGAWIGGMERLVPIYTVGLFALMIGSRYWLGSLKLLRAQRTMDTVLSVRTDNQIELKLTNQGRQKLRFRLRDEPPQEFVTSNREWDVVLGPGEEATLRYDVVPPQRGAYTFPVTLARIQAPLGLAEVEVKLPSEQAVRVYPNIKALQKFDLLNRRGRLSLIGIRRTRYRGLGTEFESLRDYTADDDYRRIDWKASARKDRLVVRDYELEKNQAVFVVIDAGRLMMADVAGASKLDHVLDAALMLMHTAEREGDQIGLLVYADSVIQYMPPRRGRAQVNMLLDAIHALEAVPYESDAEKALQYLASRWKRRALVVMFTDAEDTNGAEKLVKAIKGQRSRHLWFLARVMDPRLAELEAEQLTNMREYYQRAALSWYLDSREQAKRVLDASRFEMIEAEPQDLAQALVGAYIDAKQKAAI